MLSRFFLAVGFLTRLPVPFVHAEPAELGKCAVYFPLVGLLVGGVTAGAAMGAAALWGSPVVGAVAAILANALVTGGLHLDGLMDTSDGLFGAYDKERALEIMRDPRVGSFGALAGMVAVMVRFAFSGGAGPVAWQALLLAPVAGRCAQVWVVSCFPYARTSGLGHPFQAATRRPHALWATLLAVGICAVFAGAAGVLWLAAGGLGGALVAWRIHRRLGGLTGDGYGTVTEAAEWAALGAGMLIGGGSS